MAEPKKFNTVDEYIASFPPQVQPALEAVRQAVRKAAPGVEERISYQIPAFRLDGKYLIYFGGWKHHVGLYPISDAMRETLGDELRPYEAAKNSLHFPLDKPMPVALIDKVVKAKIQEILRAAKG